MSSIPERWRSVIPALLMIPIFAGFVFFGVHVGGAIALLTLVVIIIAAVRDENDDVIEVATPAPGVPGGVLVIALVPIEDPATAGAVAAIGEQERAEDSEYLVMTPARSSMLERWADDHERARFDGQRLLTVSLASMAAAGVRAEGRVGDGDAMQATEDILRGFAATDIVVVAAEGEFERQIAKLQRRIGPGLHRVTVPPAPS